MTTFKVVVEDEQADLLKKLLQEVSFVRSVDVESAGKSKDSTLERIKKIQQEIGDKNLFAEIKDPSNWQREIRKEWDRDF